MDGVESEIFEESLGLRVGGIGRKGDEDDGEWLLSHEGGPMVWLLGLDRSRPVLLKDFNFKKYF